ncbi:zinc finger MYM-type protein 1-like [Daktulosphaira vitifoliae]|uniref:zinc finger MYM-type protein 1-like n=1 Tax=Daktulosphaira vitifoliae TaxID=58002 RepID=UPI0021A9A95F|nr:zinc finger MYM-type protein 1-like [Daktulosphaira vitifoliae]
MHRIHSSGAAKRKKAKEGKIQTSKLPKITNFINVQSVQEADIAASVSNELGPIDETEHSESNDKTLLPLPENSEILNHKCTDDSENLNTITKYSTDLASWKDINEDLRNYCLQKDPSFFHNKNVEYTKSARIYDESEKQKIRFFHSSLFYRNLHNGETVERDWLSYSTSTGNIYCFICRLFSNERNQFALFGFRDWKHPERIVDHEESRSHKASLITYSKRRKNLNLINTQMTLQLNNEKNYWTQVLRRITDVIKFLASRGLAFRGSNQIFGSTQNGNYLGILELLSEYDSFLKDHIKTYGNKGHGITSYLSANICEEFIELMGKQIFFYIIKELKKSKYYSICVDSTPDVSHTDQLVFVVRYTTDKGPIERFLLFIPIEQHKSEYLSEVVINFLHEHNVDIQDCRGQSYDNASNMSGQYSGLQARIREINKYAIYIPCAGHSLNLVGTKAAECVPEVVAYFYLVQKLYTFFSLSTNRWQQLLSALGPENKTLKSLSTTRWSARCDAITALHNGYDKICTVLEKITQDQNTAKDTKYEAQSLFKKFKKFENIFLTIVWNDLLSRINDVNVTFQKKNMNLQVATHLLASLNSYLNDTRDKFNNFLVKAKNFTVLSEDSYNQRIKKINTRLTYFDGPSNEQLFNSDDKLRIKIFLPIIDSVCTDLKKRQEVYDKLNENFTFFTTLQKINSKQIEDACENLANIYDKDITAENLISECLHFKHYLNETCNDDEVLLIPDLFDKIKKDCISSTFPNIEICLRIYLSLMITNCTGERSFSYLKFLKSDVRNSMTQSRLNYLSIMCMESNLLNEIDFNDLINDFSTTKCRKKLFNRSI